MGEKEAPAVISECRSPWLHRRKSEPPGSELESRNFGEKYEGKKGRMDKILEGERNNKNLKKDKRWRRSEETRGPAAVNKGGGELPVSVSGRV